jgi:hypothetical protein
MPSAARPAKDAVYAALPRSEWRVARHLQAPAAAAINDSPRLAH